MRILLVNAKQSLADALASHAGIDVTHVRAAAHRNGDARAPGCVPARYYAAGGKLSLRAAWQLRKILREERPDVVHAFYGRALAHTLLAARVLPKRPKIVSFRGITSPVSRLDAGNWISYRHPLVDVHACESEAVREAMIQSGIDAARCWTTYNTMYVAPARRPGRAALEQFGIPADAFVIGTVATMRRVKGIDILLRAAIQCADLRDVYWLLLGRVIDSSIPRLADDERIRDRVRLAGHRADASELISGADVFVMPSRAESLCQALLEAMHQRVCPVVSDAGGMKEVVRHQRDGLIVPAENIDALARAIRTLHADRGLVTQFGASAEQRYAEHFTPERMAERCLSLYSQLTNTPSA